MEETGDNSIQFEIQSLEQALMMLEQRTQDLRTAENVAMQSIPMIKTMEFSNMNLVRKINSAFIITLLKVFKQALARAIMLKRQRIQPVRWKRWMKKTNEMLVKNARNTVEQSKMTARMASGSSIQIETLENTGTLSAMVLTKPNRSRKMPEKNALMTRKGWRPSRQNLIRGTICPKQGNHKRKEGKSMPINLTKDRKWI